ncbi:MAG TPA: DsrE family protein [Kofleriaceae bacterium]|nr:DsrE family protein [Kofleriaceae bacterium]
MARLALIVSTPEACGDLDRAGALALAAAAAGIDVELFFMSDAVAGLPARQGLLARLRDAGCELVACASSATERGLDQDALPMLLGSQDDHAAIVHRADRVVAFT